MATSKLSIAVIVACHILISLARACQDDPQLDERCKKEPDQHPNYDLGTCEKCSLTCSTLTPDCEKAHACGFCLGFPPTKPPSLEINTSTMNASSFGLGTLGTILLSTFSLVGIIGLAALVIALLFIYRRLRSGSNVSGSNVSGSNAMDESLAHVAYAPTPAEPNESRDPNSPAQNATPSATVQPHQDVNLVRTPSTGQRDDRFELIPHSTAMHVLLIPLPNDSIGPGNAFNGEGNRSHTMSDNSVSSSAASTLPREGSGQRASNESVSRTACSESRNNRQPNTNIQMPPGSDGQQHTNGQDTRRTQNVNDPEALLIIHNDSN